MGGRGKIETERKRHKERVSQIARKRRVEEERER